MPRQSNLNIIVSATMLLTIMISMITHTINYFRYNYALSMGKRSQDIISHGIAYAK